MPSSTCDENRLKTAADADQKLKEARALVKEGHLENALEAYLFAFDNSRFVSGWGGVRLSYIPNEIAEMGKKFPLAITALKERRDMRERLILDGETDYDLVAEWSSLNKYLGESIRELKVLEKLKKAGKNTTEVEEKIINSNFEYLLEQREYKLLKKYINDFGRRFMHQIFHYETHTLIPRDKDRWEPETMAAYWKDHIRQVGAQVFEVALGSKNDLIADEIAKRVLLHCNDLQSFAVLTKAAIRAGRKKKATELMKLAKATLPPEERRLLDESSN